MANFYIKKDATRPFLKVTLTEEDVVVDVSTATITFFMWNKLTQAIIVDNESADITDGPNGEFEYRWGVYDTAGIGLYQAEFKIIFTDNTVLRVPAQGYIEIEVIQDIEVIP